MKKGISVLVLGATMSGMILPWLAFAQTDSAQVRALLIVLRDKLVILKAQLEALIQANNDVSVASRAVSETIGALSGLTESDPAFRSLLLTLKSRLEVLKSELEELVRVRFNVRVSTQEVVQAALMVNQNLALR